MTLVQILGAIAGVVALAYIALLFGIWWVLLRIKPPSHITTYKTVIK